MKNAFQLFVLLFSLAGFGQDEEIHSIYFEFDKFQLKETQIESVINFLSTIDTTKIETIEIFGYCDDRGKDEYNFILSTKRANTVKDNLIERGIKSKIIITLEGKGSIRLDEDIQDNIPEARSKNRRVDVVVNFKPVVVTELKLPGIYNKIPENPVVGDRIFLDKLFFDRGSSKLTHKAKQELDQLAKQLQKHKNIQFEIQGHVCCTPTFQKEAVDKNTKKRELSKNRALAVFNYLAIKRIAKSRMQHKGYGNTQSLGKGSQFDRRVELVITKI